MAVKVKKHRGCWWVFVNHRGQRIARKIGSSREAADTASATIQLRLVNGDAADQAVAALTPAPTAPAFAEYAERWLTEAIRPHRKPRTEDYYRQIVANHLTPIFGTLPLDRIKPAHVRTFIANKLAGRHCEKHDSPAAGCDACVAPLARNTVKNAAATLRAVLYQAQVDTLIASNPAARFGRLFNARHDARGARRGARARGCGDGPQGSREMVPRSRARGAGAVLHRDARG
jgi:hypothetical protein